MTAGGLSLFKRIRRIPRQNALSTSVSATGQSKKGDSIIIHEDLSGELAEKQLSVFLSVFRQAQDDISNLAYSPLSPSNPRLSMSAE